MLIHDVILAGLCLLPTSSASVVNTKKPDGYREYRWGLNFTDGEWEDPDWDTRKDLQQKMEEASKFTCSQKEVTSVND